MKPSIPKGTRDFSPQEMVKRNYIFDTIRKVYQSYGYQPIETPAFENFETLMGKYGDEGDRLIFKIYDSGNVLEGLGYFEIKDIFDNEIGLEEGNVSDTDKFVNSSWKIQRLKDVVEEFIKSKFGKALRYDLTVPFARYVVQHRNDITFPFKRYQIQPVWRADRPQKGRYREFYQCDADVIGSDSLLNEVELIQIIDEVFTKLGVPVVIKINNRKILQGMAEYIGAPDRMVELATAMDKGDKIGKEGVLKELKERGFNVEKVSEFFTIATKEDIANLKSGEDYKRGVEEMEFVRKICKSLLTSQSSLQFDISLARGLNYYTGTIIEVKVDTSKCASQFTSSICGGGRYDDLTGIFGLPDVSGVGISFGADRIYDVIEELGLFPEEIAATTKVMLINFEGVDDAHYLKILKELHKAGISSELYPDKKKINKQFEYADKRNIPYVVIIGGDEINKGVLKLRNMKTKEEKELTREEATKYLTGI